MKNNKGFMLVEALVMSTIIIGTLTFMYIQFQNISRSYERSFNYNSVNNLYITNEIKEYLVINGKLNALKKDVDNSKNGFVEVTYTEETWKELLTKANIKQDENTITVVLAEEKLSGLQGNRTIGLSEKFNDFINYVKVDNENDKYRLLIEFEDGTYASLKIGE